MGTPPRPPVSAEARGLLRGMLATWEAGAATMARRRGQDPARTLDCPSYKGKVGTARALARIAAAMPRPPDHRKADMLIWRYPQPVDAIPNAAGTEDERPRPGVVIMGVVAGRRARPCRPERFGLAFSLHSLGRLLDRSAFAADVHAAMFECHDALMTLQKPEGTQIFGLGSILLPAAGGFIRRGTVPRGHE